MFFMKTNRTELHPYLEQLLPFLTTFISLRKSEILCIGSIVATVAPRVRDTSSNTRLSYWDCLFFLEPSLPSLITSWSCSLIYSRYCCLTVTFYLLVAIPSNQLSSLFVIFKCYLVISYHSKWVVLFFILFQSCAKVFIYAFPQKQRTITLKRTGDRGAFDIIRLTVHPTVYYGEKEWAVM